MYIFFLRTPLYVGAVNDLSIFRIRSTVPRKHRNPLANSLSLARYERILVSPNTALHCKSYVKPKYPKTLGTKKIFFSKKKKVFFLPKGSYEWATPSPFQIFPGRWGSPWIHFSTLAQPSLALPSPAQPSPPLPTPA